MSNEIDVGSLKVAELKEELAKRDLPTNGLKKDLATRLQEAIENDQNNDKNVIEEGVEVQDEQSGKKLVEDKEEAPQEIRDGPETVFEKPSEVEEDKDEEHQDGEVQIDRKPDPADDIAEEALAQDHLVNNEAAPAVEMGMEIESGPPKADGATSLGERLSEKIVINAEDEVEVGDVDFEMDVEVHNEEPRSVSPLYGKKAQRDSIQDTDQIATQMAQKESGLSPYLDPPAALSLEQASLSKSLSELPNELAQLEKPSRSIYIAGLVRPLTLPHLRSKVEEYGDLGGDDVEEGQEIWLDGVKTHAYVTYQDESSAVAAKTALSGSVYPPETGKEIKVYYIPQAIVKQCIAIEETAWQEDRGKLEMKARVDSGEQIIYFSLHRSETGSAVKKLESSLPPSSGRSNHQSSKASDRERRPFGREQQRLPRPQSSNFQWGNSSDYAHKLQLHQQNPYNYPDPRPNPRGGERYKDRGRRDERDSGSSRAEERVRQVEARIRAERERGDRGFHRDGLPPGRGDTYNANHRSRPFDQRWSDHNASYRRPHDDRRREHSPPTKSSRDYPDRARDYSARW